MNTKKYSEQDINVLVEAFADGMSTQEIAAKLGRSNRSVIAKLSQLGVYKATASTSTPRVTKASLVMELEQVLGFSPGTLDTVANASLSQLQLLLNETKYLKMYVDDQRD